MPEGKRLGFRWAYRLGILGAVSLTVLGCASSSSEPVHDGPFELELAGETRRAERISLSVPLRHDDPEGPKILIGVVRIFGENRNLAPFFFLAGGPGSSGISKFLHKGAQLAPIEKLILKHADIVHIDQRGAGTARPRLICDDTAELPLIPAPDRELMLAIGSRVAEDCAKIWRKKGIDLQAFNTEESARDLEAVRQALSLPRISLLGGSYGSHLAFAYLRRFGGSVDFGVLYGIQGPDHTYDLPLQIDELLETMDKRTPLDDGRSIQQLAKQVRARLESEPVRVRIDSDTEIELGVFDFQKFLADATLKYDIHRGLPPAIARMADGDFTELARWRLPFRTRGNWNVNAMRAAMICASGVSTARLRSIAEQALQSVGGDELTCPLPEICRAWGVEPLPPLFRAPLSSDVPMLFFSGVFDARTPASNAREMLSWFPNAHHVIVSNLGHASCYVEACLDLVEELLTKGSVDRPRIIEISPSQEEIYRSFGRKPRARRRPSGKRPAFASRRDDWWLPGAGS